MPPSYVPQLLPSPLDLPEGSSGVMRVRHKIEPAGAKLDVIGLRQALMRGVRPVAGRLSAPRRVHQLIEEGAGLWMSDAPEELNQISEMLHQVRPRGRVLVGGLGLGIVATLVTVLPAVTAVTVVEISPDVIKLCARPGYTVIEASIEEHLATHPTPYDTYLLDTWSGTSEGTWWDTVLPLRRAIRRRWGPVPVIHCWAEDIMRGQLTRTLVTTEPHWYYSYLPVPMPLPAARRFLRDPGLPAWEARYGPLVDRYRREATAE